MKIIKKDKNKLKLKAKSKILVLGLILIALVGLFSPKANVNAQTEPRGECRSGSGDFMGGDITQAECKKRAASIDAQWDVYWTPSDPPQTTIIVREGIAKVGQTPPSAPSTSKADNAFQRGIDDACNTSPTSWFTGCVLKIIYYTWFQLPSLLLYVSAQFFNAMISIGIGSMTASTPFLSAAWGVIRDLANIFFILTLLYIAIKLILGLGGSEAKKMIVWVIIMALLINFSMFFTKVVIDSSNILALVFYSKLDTTYKDSAGNRAERPNVPSTSGNEKDLSGAMYKNFNPTRLLDEKFLTAFRTTNINGRPVESELSFSMKLGIIVIAGAIMAFAAYTFFIAGFMFLGRLIELWVLIIFSPFAFMSFAIPELSKVPYIGWGDWSKRLIATSFMAPIFMLFMYLIFKLLDANIFSTFTTGQGSMAMLLSVLIPALMILALLMNATKFAMKGGGQFGEMIMKGGKMVAGLAGGLVLGAATGGTAVALRATAGRLGSSLADSEWAKRRESEGKFGAGVLRNVAKYTGAASFDARGVKIGGKTLAGATGFNLGQAQKGGFVEGRKEQVAKRQKRAQELEIGEDAPLKQKLNKAQADLQELVNFTHDEFEEIDRDLERARKRKSDAARGSQAETDANDDIAKLRARKNNIAQSTKVSTGENAGKTMEEMEDTVVPHVKHEIAAVNRERKINYADSQQTGWEKTKGFMLSGGAYTGAAAREASHKIRTEAKIEHVSKGRGGGNEGHAAAVAHAPTPAAKTTAPAAGGGGGHAPAGGGHH